jgi:hypothetical protein
MALGCSIDVVSWSLVSKELLWIAMNIELQSSQEQIYMLYFNRLCYTDSRVLYPYKELLLLGVCLFAGFS